MPDNDFAEIVQEIKRRYGYPVQISWPVAVSPIYFDVPSLVNDSIVQFARRK